MKTPKLRSIFNIVDHVPSKRKPVYSCYDNKFLSKFTCDDFAELVFDNLNAKGKPCWDKKHFLYQIEMLDYIPENYARVYLYGVWQTVKPAIAKI
jgi:hypothetical protein